MNALPINQSIDQSTIHQLGVLVDSFISKCRLTVHGTGIYKLVGFASNFI